MHTYTDETSPIASGLCTNCHGDNTAKVACNNEDWTEHSDKGRVSRNAMDKVERELLGDVCGSSNPLTTVCVSCHGDKSNKVSCNEKDFLEHVERGRVSTSVWEAVATQLTGGTCGY
jgi:cytochrome c553